MTIVLRVLVAAVAVLCASALSGHFMFRDAPLVALSAHPYTASASPWVIAHRGGMALWPENTLFAFERAVAAGADVIEMDLRPSRDGVLMVIHDATVDRVTNGTGAVDELTRDELQELDAAHHFTAASGDTPHRGWGMRIPTLEEVIERLPDVRISVELKPDDPALAGRLCSLIREKAAQERMMVGSFVAEIVVAFRRACPEVATAFSVPEATAFYARARLGLPSTERPPAQVIITPLSILGLDGAAPSLLRQARRLGLRTQVFTANTEAQMRAVLKAGVDGILTDDPLLLRRVIDSMASKREARGFPVMRIPRAATAGSPGR